MRRERTKAIPTKVVQKIYKNHKYNQTINMVEKLITKEIDQDILDKSIILIGPMGSGKSSVAKKLSEKTGIERLSLDNREQLKNIYEKEKEFNHFKEFELYLTTKTLTDLKDPKIIDFGAGHSIYEDEKMYSLAKNLISNFKNVVLLIPSEDKEESISILNERKGIRPGSNDDETNRLFVGLPNNHEITKYTIYTKDKTPEEISDDLIKIIKSKEKTR